MCGTRAVRFPPVNDGLQRTATAVHAGLAPAATVGSGVAAGSSGASALPTDAHGTTPAIVGENAQRGSATGAGGTLGDGARDSSRREAAGQGRDQGTQEHVGGPAGATPASTPSKATAGSAAENSAAAGALHPNAATGLADPDPTSPKGADAGQGRVLVPAGDAHGKRKERDADDTDSDVMVVGNADAGAGEHGVTGDDGGSSDEDDGGGRVHRNASKRGRKAKVVKPGRDWTCTLCEKTCDIETNPPAKHTEGLSVVICMDCWQYNKRYKHEFDRNMDEDGSHNQCTWCLNGGELVCCDYCPRSYCEACFERNGLDSLYTQITTSSEEGKWSCLKCDSAQLGELADDYDAYLQYQARVEAADGRARRARAATQIVDTSEDDSEGDASGGSDDGRAGGAGKGDAAPSKPRAAKRIKAASESSQQLMQTEKMRKKQREEWAKQRSDDKAKASAGGSGSQAAAGQQEIVINVARPKDDPAVVIATHLASNLKKHQIDGIRFMWSASVHSLKEFKESSGHGAILAHNMGLGKSLQVVTFLHTVLRNPSLQPGARNAIIVTPKNTLFNWVNEFEKWAYRGLRVHVVNPQEPENYRRATIRSWGAEDRSVLIIGYTMYMRLAKNKRKKEYKALVDPGPDFLILDEGHTMVSRRPARRSHRRRTPVASTTSSCSGQRPAVSGREKEGWAARGPAAPGIALHNPPVFHPALCALFCRALPFLAFVCHVEPALCLLNAQPTSLLCGTLCWVTGQPQNRRVQDARHGEHTAADHPLRHPDSELA